MELEIYTQDMIVHINSDYNYKYCKNKILELKKKQIPFYIGITKQPFVRIFNHYNDKNATKMHILCKLPTKYQAEILEKKLIKYFQRNTYLYNQGGGGEGIINGENYLYLLL
jgi:hypothetical protein